METNLDMLSDTGEYQQITYLSILLPIFLPEEHLGIK